MYQQCINTGNKLKKHVLFVIVPLRTEQKSTFLCGLYTYFPKSHPIEVHIALVVRTHKNTRVTVRVTTVNVHLCISKGRFITIFIYVCILKQIQIYEGMKIFF